MNSFNNTETAVFPMQELQLGMDHLPLEHFPFPLQSFRQPKSLNVFNSSGVNIPSCSVVFPPGAKVVCGSG